MKSKDIDALYMRWDLVDGNREDDEFAKKLRCEIDRAVRKARREERKKLLKCAREAVDSSGTMVIVVDDPRLMKQWRRT